MRLTKRDREIWRSHKISPFPSRNAWSSSKPTADPKSSRPFVGCQGLVTRCMQTDLFALTPQCENRRRKIQSVPRKLSKPTHKDGSASLHLAAYPRRRLGLVTFSTSGLQTLAWIDSLTRASIFVDVGENGGLYSVYVGVMGRRVLATEPRPATDAPRGMLGRISNRVCWPEA